MSKCFKNHIRLAGCTIAIVTTASEVMGLCYYLLYYVQFVQKEISANNLQRSEDYDSKILVDSGDRKGVDPGALIGVTIVFFSVLFCNILLFYGVWRRKLLCFLPWLLLHAALFMEAIGALIFCIVKSVKSSTLYTPMLSVLIIVVFISVVWILIKELFVSLYTSSPSSGMNGSDYSRDHILEMQSFVHSSPRVSYVTAMGEGIHRVAL